jgi:hypothetical protein
LLKILKVLILGSFPFNLGEESRFFFEKKNQETFGNVAAPGGEAEAE